MKLMRHIVGWQMQFVVTTIESHVQPFVLQAHRVYKPILFDAVINMQENTHEVPKPASQAILSS